MRDCCCQNAIKSTAGQNPILFRVRPPHFWTPKRGGRVLSAKGRASPAFFAFLALWREIFGQNYAPQCQEAAVVNLAWLNNCLLQLHLCPWTLGILPTFATNTTRVIPAGSFSHPFPNPFNHSDPGHWNLVGSSSSSYPFIHWPN